MRAVAPGQAARRTLSDYLRADVAVARQGGTAHLLLTHDGPIDAHPEFSGPVPVRAEAELAEALAPRFHLCGHDHRPFQATLPNGTQVRGLNILSGEENGPAPRPGWAWLGRWDGKEIIELGFWPPVANLSRS